MKPFSNNNHSKNDKNSSNYTATIINGGAHKARKSDVLKTRSEGRRLRQEGQKPGSHEVKKKPGSRQEREAKTASSEKPRSRETKSQKAKKPKDKKYYKKKTSKN